MHGLKIQEKKITDEKESAQEIVDRAESEGIISEKDILTLKSRMNSGEKFQQSEYLSLYPDQIDKGRKWLMNQYKSPTGSVRKNNPFEDWQIDVIEGDNFDIKFRDWWNIGRYQPIYEPVYQVTSDNGEFDYYNHNGIPKVV